MLGLLPLLLAAPVLLQDAPTSDPADVDAWSDDVFALIDALESMHPDPYAGCPREVFAAGVDTFLAGLERWDETRATTEFLRLVALLSRRGREGHAGVFWLDALYLPARVYRFADGWFVVDAPEGLGELVGAQLLSIGGVAAADVAGRLAPLFCHDSPSHLASAVARELTCASLLAGVGIPSGPDGFAVHLRRPDGTELERTLPARRPGHAEWVQRMSRQLPERGDARWLRHLDVPFRMEMLAPEKALYVQYNEVRSAMEDGTTLVDFASAMVARFTSEHATRLVLDVRSNGGGDNTTFGPLIEALKTPAIDRPDVLFALIGPGTFSAAGNFAAVLDAETRATLVGEPTGGAPNQYGDARDVELPGHPNLRVRLATRHHVFGPPDDPRLSVEPDVAVPLTSADYFAGRDPVLARALGAR